MSEEITVKQGIYKSIENVLIVAINKGQLIPLAIGTFLIISVLRLSEKVLGNIAISITEAFISGYFLGYFLSGILLIAWIFNIKWLKRRMGREIDRLSLERNRLQKQLITGKIESSEEE